ncbi:sporulation protein YpjB [Melghirimyces profundicolus]|uniref:Sporulation protein YpjB n=1 Tax=Melghirimyces profundicolus TaxID=1242148 RepID=A0A2T6BV53_9BACL|nr:sporulation protein YpjB [Melghirimyces profundicolus]PTX59926.1 sporulation protein YpjB [Melghirimyces profundicolus]
MSRILLAGVVLVHFILFTPAAVLGKEESPVQHWADEAVEIHRLVEKGELERAKGKLENLADRFSNGDFSRIRLSVEGMEALSDTLVELDRELVRVMPRPDRLLVASKRMMLAFDALAHPRQPLWHQYESVWKDDVTSVKQRMKKNRPETVRSAVGTLVRHYRTVEPALYVSRNPETVGAVSTLVHSLERQAGRKPMKPALLTSTLKQWERMIRPLIDGKEQDVLALAHTGMPAWPKAALTLGGIIACALTYVSWQKYRQSRVFVHRRS